MPPPFRPEAAIPLKPNNPALRKPDDSKSIPLDSYPIRNCFSIFRMSLKDLDLVENRRRWERGELFYAFAPDVIASRRRCIAACNDFNAVGSTLDFTRRQMVELWKR